MILMRILHTVTESTYYRIFSGIELFLCKAEFCVIFQFHISLYLTQMKSGSQFTAVFKLVFALLTRAPCRRRSRAEKNVDESAVNTAPCGFKHTCQLLLLCYYAETSYSFGILPQTDLHIEISIFEEFYRRPHRFETVCSFRIAVLPVGNDYITGKFFAKLDNMR